MNSSTPTFAIVGAVNHGKSSVVSTLAEDDQVRISSMPGETVGYQRFELLDLFVFYDTPGFQNAFEACEELKAAQDSIHPLKVFQDFIARHQGQPEFDAECQLLKPIVDGAGIIYVVDGSEPLRKFHLAEMEILRLTGQPRLAIINRRNEDNHVEEWKRKLGAHFNAVREFNAHYATFADRLELLDTLASIEQSWKPKLKQAVEIFRQERESRLDDCAEVITELLVEALRYRQAANPGNISAAERIALGTDLKQRFVQAVSEKEARAHREIIRLFRHHRVQSESAGELLFDSELFGDETWKAFGLNERQLISAGALGGAAAGASTDLLTAGHTLFAGTAIGTLIGAAGGYFVGRRRPELKVEMPGLLRGLGLGQSIDLAGNEVSVGPYTAANFPWILIDRAFGTCYYVMNRAHARQDRVTINSLQVKEAMRAAGISTAQWESAARKQCEQLFYLIRKRKLSYAQREELRGVIRKQLARVAFS